MNRCRMCLRLLIDMRPGAFLCGARSCRNAWERLRRKKQKAKTPRFCKYCGADISHRRLDAEKCDNQQCVNAYWSEWSRERSEDATA